MIVCPVAANLTSLNTEDFKSFAVAAKKLTLKRDLSWVHYSLLPRTAFSGWKMTTTDSSELLEFFAGDANSTQSGIIVLNAACFSSIVQFFRQFKPELVTVEGLDQKVSIFAVINVD